MTPAPPTIAHLKGHGLEGLFVTCANAACMHATAFTFDALSLADDVQFPPYREPSQRRDNSKARTGLDHHDERWIPAATCEPNRSVGNARNADDVRANPASKRVGQCSNLNQPASVTEEHTMATFVTLYKFTEQGLRNIKDTPSSRGLAWLRCHRKD